MSFPLMVLALVACKPEPTGSSLTLDPTMDDAPSDYDYEAPQAAVELLDMDTLGRGIGEALAVSVGLSGAPILAGYDTIMASADDSCPAYYETDGNFFWYDYCTTDSGTTFDGYGFYYAYEDYDDGSTVWNGGTFTGLAHVEDSEGRVFDAGGSVGTLYSESNGWDVIYTSVYGGFAWNGEEADGTWLETEADPDLYLYGMWSDDADGWYIYLEGAASGVSDDLSAISIDGVALGNAAGGFTCAIEPIGDLRVRDALGTWYDVDFDAVQGRDNNACDGCGAVSVEGESIGEVCVDISNLEDSLPW